MNFQLTILTSLLVTLFLFSNLQMKAQIQVQTQCEDPLSIDWVKSAVTASCTDSIFFFTYNLERYIYVKRKEECLAVDWSNTLYNCKTDTFCSVFGLTLPSERCSTELLKNIVPFFIEENAIFPKERNCKPSPNLYAEEGDVYIDESCYGVILTSPNGSCFRLKVQNTGTVNAEPVRCPQ